MPRLNPPSFVAPSLASTWLHQVLVVWLLALILPAPARAVFGDDNDLSARTSGTVGTINVTGISHTDRDLVLRVFGLREGDTFTREQLNRGWDHLEDCGYFSFVEIEYDDDQPDDIRIDIALNEDMTTYYGPLVRYSRRHKYLLGAWLEERNFRGRGETIRAEVSTVYLQRGSLSWRRPWLAKVAGLETVVALDGEQADFVFRPFRYHKWDASWDLRWQFSGDFFVGTNVTYGLFAQRDDYTDHPAASENHWVFTGRAGFDSRDNPYYPRRGLLAQLSTRHWQSNSLAGYTDNQADVRAYLNLPGRTHILALRAWGRRVDGPTNIDDALFFGGPETVRGYRYASREGENGYLLSVEYRLPLFLMKLSPDGETLGLGFHLFGDAGDAWFDGAAAQVAQMSYGAGTHLNLDTWQLRFEAARTKEGRWQFEFMDKFNF